jgi:type VI secretion system secreted protein Hcp
VSVLLAVIATACVFTFASPFLQDISQGLNPFSSVDSASSVPQPSAFDSFLKIDAIPGESTDQDHSGWIEVLSFSLGMHKASAVDAVSHDRLYILKTIDKSSPKLYEYCNTGQSIPEMTLQVVNPSDRWAVMTITLKDLIVSSVDTGISITKEYDVSSPKILKEIDKSSPYLYSQHLEEVSFTYGRISWNYTYADPSGQGTHSEITSWNIQQNSIT